MGLIYRLQRKHLRLANRALETGSLRQAALEQGYSPNYIGQLYQLASDPDSNLGKYLTEQKEEMALSITITKEKKRNKLWQIAEQCSETKPMVALKAIHELNRMDGHL